MGNPNAAGEGAYAELSTVGGTLWIAANGCSHGGILERDVNYTSIKIGLMSDPSRFVSGRRAVENAVQEVSVREGAWVSFELPAGEYWFTSSNALAPFKYTGIVVQSCEPEVILDRTPYCTIEPEGDPSPSPGLTSTG